MLSKEALSELKDILEQDYKMNLSDDEVFECGQAFIGLFEELAKQNRKDAYEHQRLS